MTVSDSRKCPYCTGDLEAQNGRVAHIDCQKLEDLTERIQRLQDGIDLVPCAFIGSLSFAAVLLSKSESALGVVVCGAIAIAMIYGIIEFRKAAIAELQKLEPPIR